MNRTSAISLRLDTLRPTIICGAPNTLSLRLLTALHPPERASKTLNPNDAIGESIGIEKISDEAAAILFSVLRLMMEDQINHKEYYEAAYELLIDQDVAFFALDITGLK